MTLGSSAWGVTVLNIVEDVEKNELMRTLTDRSEVQNDSMIYQIAQLECFIFFNFDRLTTIDIEPAHHLLDTVSRLPDTVVDYRSATHLTCGGDSYLQPQPGQPSPQHRKAYELSYRTPQYQLVSTTVEIIPLSLALLTRLARLSGTMRAFFALVMGLSMLSVVLAAAIPAGLEAIASTTLAVSSLAASSLAASSVSLAPSARFTAPANASLIFVGSLPGLPAPGNKAAASRSPIFAIPATVAVPPATATAADVATSTSTSSLSPAASATQVVHHAGVYLPYQCSTAWSLEESLPNPAACSYCYDNETNACYEALNCQWSYRLDGLICPGGLPSASKPSSVATSATTAPAPSATPQERCLTEYDIVLDVFNIWGANWDQQKLDGKGTPGWGKGLYHQLHGCGGLSHWRFEPIAPTPEHPYTFHAWGRTTIWKGLCIERAMRSAGAPRGHCYGTT
ncbi:hypothetical protein LTR02_017164 [Friedmanniomyces endolithicus]|nr:hypothetical protein LTR94_006768 [Friedmanniomyces endolithicus]KAK0792519.1 hypothetical protein LTR59_008520 [Friedmanniomyces endolithicus]KAK0803914.1 hypothetical protein LTR38_005972 [Friedmanniomyces endolithicus]KAK0814000.1 hypothetical protein LTR75_004455 [Friedmanniomyces endolithicus]KAK0830078.1 hypothetical protein LTR03_016017 [Friedmanniomyces endolithicus]